MPQKRCFFQDGVENAAVLAAFCCARKGLVAACYAAGGASAMRKNRGIQKNGKRNILARALNSGFQTQSNCRAARWRSVFWSGLEQFQGAAGCSFWTLATPGKSFFTIPENHFNCAVGAYTHNIPLSPARKKETERTLKMMFDLQLM